MSKNGNKIKRKGAALLVVLFIVMAATILSLGFLSRSDVELSCGNNMLLCTEMDYLAESGLEHAKGLILNPQDVSTEYWIGDVGQQLSGGNDYYDVSVVQHDPCDGPTYRCNYDITCEAYRDKNGERIGRRILKGELRLDPCVALWTGVGAAVTNRVTINGDVYCSGTLTNNGVINGDVFANGLNGTIAGRQKSVTDLSLSWPRVTAADFTSHYATEPIVSNSLSGVALGPYNPVRVCYRVGDLELAGGAQINGMLVVDGDLTIWGNGNDIIAEKNLPALLVTGDLIIEDGGQLDVCGLAVVDGRMQISGDSTGVSIVGGLFVKDGIVETAKDWSDNGNIGTLYNGPTWQPSGGQIDGALEFDGSDDFVVVAHSPSFDVNHITVAVWFYQHALGDERLVCKSTSTVIADHIFSLATYYGKVRVRLDTNDGAAVNYDGTVSFNANEWVHAAFTYDGQDIRIYLNGTENGVFPKQGDIAKSNISIVIGNVNLSDNRYFNGNIDDVRIYDRALDANDIPPADGLSGLVGHWKLDGGGNNITMTAAPSKAAIMTWSETGVEEKWGQAAGAFFRSIRRN